MMNLKKNCEGSGSFYALSCCDSYSRKCFLVFLFSIIPFWGFSQTSVSATNVTSSNLKVDECSLVTNESQLVIVGEAFVYVEGNVLVSKTKQKHNEFKASAKKKRKFVATKKEGGSKEILPKVFAKNGKGAAFKFHSKESDTSVFSTRILHTKVAVSNYSKLIFKEMSSFSSIVKNLELLYQKRPFHYTSNIDVSNLSLVFSTRPPPILYYFIMV